jgi:hypothetical protein
MFSSRCQSHERLRGAMNRGNPSRPGFLLIGKCAAHHICLQRHLAARRSHPTARSEQRDASRFVAWRQMSDRVAQGKAGAAGHHLTTAIGTTRGRMLSAKSTQGPSGAKAAA